MPHLKKDFHRRNSFDNKYYNHSYINYLLNDKVKFQMNKYELYLDRFIVSTIDFVIQLNNAIARRGKREHNIEDIKKLYDKPIKNNIYLYYGTKTISEIFKGVKYGELTDDIEKEIYSILEQIIYWKDNFDKDYEKFKQIYYSMVYLNAKDKAKTFEMVCDILITIADIHNELISKDYDNAYEILENYIKDNVMMKECKDIYYLKIYIDLEKLFATFKQKTYTNIIDELKNIIANENYKYKKYMMIYENIAIDKEALNNGEYYEL